MGFMDMKLPSCRIEPDRRHYNMATSKANAKKFSRTILALSTAGTRYQFLTRPGMNRWITPPEKPSKKSK